MKHKLLLVGRNRRLINDFFMQLDFYFECMSSSVIFADLKAHYQYFKPDAVVYCMHSEQRDDMVSVISFVENTIKKEELPFIVISDNFDYDFLCKLPGGRADVRISTSESIHFMQEEIISVVVKNKNKAMEKANKKVDIDSMDNTAALLARMESELDSLNSEESKEKNSGGWDSGKHTSHSARPRILVVDDSTIIHKTLKSYMENDYDVSSAISGMAALKFLNVKEVDLILLDYEMPEMSGPDVLKKLRENPMTADIPVVFLTGINDASKIQKALVLKPDGYLLKPVEKSMLMEKIKELLEHN